MDKIRIGNDIHIEWSIFRDNQPEVFEGKDVEVRLIHTRTRDVIPLEWVISDGVVSATFYGKDQIDTGDYKLMLVENNGLPNMATIDECKAFTLVQCSCQEQKEKLSTSLQLHKVQLVSSFALSGGGNINVEGYPNVDELEEVKELSGNENIIITDSEGNKKTTTGNLKEYVVKDISELPPFKIFETESDYNAVKDELGDCVVCLRDTGVMLYHVYGKAEDGEEGGGEIEDKYIRFADPEVQRILVENFSSDGVGMTSEDIAKVRNIGTIFSGNTEITSFDELKNFTSIKTIGDSAFRDCSNLLSIDLTNVEYLGSKPFANTNLGEYDLNMPNLIGLQSGIDEEWSQWFLDSSIRSIKDTGNLSVFPDGIYLSGVVFSTFANSKLKKVHLNSNIRKIGYGTFFCCSELNELTIDEGLQIIGESSFGGCTSLKNVTLPSSVTDIAALAFVECNFEYIKIKAIVPPALYDTNAFLVTVGTNYPFYVPDASVEAYKGATNWSTYAARIKGISELPIDNAELYN